jgi:predicted nucleotidyltransferase
MKYGLQSATIEKINSLLSHYPQVEEAILYGSRAAGNYRNGSDIDLTLYGAALTFGTLNKIIDDLDSLFLPYTIDLSIFANISDPDIIDHIRRVGVTFYKRMSEQVKVS